MWSLKFWVFFFFLKCQAVVGLWRVFLNGNKTSGFVKPLLSIWVTCLILLVQMKRDEPIVTEERRAEHCKKVGWCAVLEGRCDWWLYN